jgi:hypothetical protein
MPSKCAQCKLRPVFGAATFCGGCQYQQTEVKIDKAQSPARCAAEGCRKFVIAGEGDCCKDHQIAEQDHSAAGALDINPQWHTLDKVSATPTQSKSTAIVRTAAASGSYVLKSDTDSLHELFAGQLALVLGISAPKARVLTVLDMEWVLVQCATSAFISSAKSDHTCVATSRIGQAALLMEFIPGAKMLTGETPASAAEVFGSSTPLGQQNLRDLGKIVAFDMLINNTDRIPAVWDNNGNLGNLLFDTTGAIIAIDHVVAPSFFGAANSNQLLEAYLKRVDALLADVCRVQTLAGTAADGTADGTSQPLTYPTLKSVRDFIRKATGHDIGTPGCGLLAEGIRGCVGAVSQVCNSV